ncbi:hypothetical protein K461DRAFT_308850 [Myriangium duriaei CBS 260.36]|uniref:Sexual development protein n=1 Tax=Myriangium duriaei CBS 260.36 TaxID=1168546 RepID=A0A9P4JBF2_9PEZI|nr:hypothetical protein K461DRAFT_308850 [Myriangium duriaei CBS 260.36]
MRTFLLTAASLATALAAPQYQTKCSPTSVRQGAFQFPLADGFPDVLSNKTAIAEISKQAHGSLPNGSLPTKIADTTAVVLNLIATNELFEVAYFHDLLANLTNGVEGYRIGDDGLESREAYHIAVKGLRVIEAQEKLHAIGANAILATAGRPTVSPCHYQFPVQTFQDAITFAATFTDLVLGTLQEVIYAFATDGDAELTALVGSIIGNEAEQEGYFRLAQSPYGKKVPSALPFLTASSGAFAFNALNQLVLVPGTCPDQAAIPLPVFQPLSVDTPAAQITDNTTSVDFSFATSNQTFASSLSLVYINQQNIPVVEKLQNVEFANGVAKFSAPFAAANMNGLTIAALTNCVGPFTNASNVVSYTVYGPGLIELN